MKKIFAVLTIMLLPLITFGDLLPEPDILVIDDNEIITLENDENIGNESSLEQESTGNNTLTEMDDINDENQKQQADLVDVYFGFCNDGVDHLTDTLNAAMIQGDPFPMCLLLYNSDPNNTAYIDINLVYGTLAGDGSPACDVKGMNEFVSSGSMGLVEIPADNYVIKEVEITFPLGYDGEQKACITVSSVDQSPQEEVGGLVILERRAYHASFFVGAIDGIKNEIKVNELATNVDDNGDLILSFFVENIGNMENTFDIQGAVKGFFGYNKAFEVADGQVAPGRSQYIELNLGSLPSYGGKFDIDFTINGTPYFSYDISNANVDPARLEPKSRTFGTTYFKMPWLILAVVVIFILLLIVLFKKPKQKVVYVQQAQQSQQPVQAQPVQQPTQQYTQPVQPSQPVQQPVQQPTQPVQQPQQPQNQNYPQN